MKLLKEYHNFSLSFSGGRYYVYVKDVVIKTFNFYNEALSYYNALCSLKYGGGYPSPLNTEQFGMEVYDSSNDQ
jgi:hypothetical protein